MICEVGQKLKADLELSSFRRGYHSDMQKQHALIPDRLTDQKLEHEQMNAIHAWAEHRGACNLCRSSHANSLARKTELA